MLISILANGACDKWVGCNLSRYVPYTEAGLGNFRSEMFHYYHPNGTNLHSKNLVFLFCTFL